MKAHYFWNWHTSQVWLLVRALLPKQFSHTLLAAQPHVSNLLPLLPPRSISGGDANNMDELSFQNHASLPTDTVRPCEGKSFLLSYEDFPFKECCVIPSPRGGWLLAAASNDPHRPQQSSFIFQPFWPGTEGLSLFSSTYLEGNRKASISLRTTPLPCLVSFCGGVARIGTADLWV